MDERERLEKELLGKPFNTDLRLRYAELLLREGDANAALDQFLLVREQNARHAAAAKGVARALLALDRAPEALSIYTEARRLPDFEPDVELDTREANARPVAGPQLRVVAGQNENVVSFRQVSGEQVRFSSIIGMDGLKKSIRLKTIEPFLNPGLFQRFRKSAGGGILLYGPPGCGKTMIARAVANECKAEFISVGISDVLNMWIGESERNIASIFAKARTNTPCVLFFDELDALAYSRSKANSDHTRTTVNELLSQLDGIGRDNQGVLILAATNMPWDVDAAMKRPGRFSRQIFVEPPDAAARQAMLEAKLTDIPMEKIDLRRIAERADFYSGADIDGLIELAKEAVLEESLNSGNERALRQDDFVHALEEMRPSTKDWLRTARNLVKYSGDDGSYRDVEAYLKRAKFL